MTTLGYRVSCLPEVALLAVLGLLCSGAYSDVMLNDFVASW